MYLHSAELNVVKVTENVNTFLLVLERKRAAMALIDSIVFRYIRF